VTARIIDGAALAKRIRAEIRNTLETLGGSASSTGASAGNRPGLTVILVGEDPASRVYVRNKIKACAEAGIDSHLIELTASTTEAELLDHISVLNAAVAVHGILVQLPLPAHINSHRVIEAINPAKDVDGFHVSSAGALMTGLPGFAPCTPAGVMQMLAAEGIAVEGRHAVVVGRSNLVGKPMAMLLLQAGATVTICHSKTDNLGALTRQADILVAAVGRVNLITREMVKVGACVIDVGINRDAAGKLCGDVDFAGVSQVASAITPVPGGVGPMTIAMLLANTLKAFQSS
jgi:methylenetetrahydrofolate dehydrogenase (NADP+) / methenyltetrahydrofolate cyclohydrolase